MEFLASLCSHAMEKGPCRSLLPRCPKCLFPNFMVESMRSCELIFEKILISYKQLPRREANAEKLESSNFLSTTVKENKNSFAKFDKETDCFDTFIWHFPWSFFRYVTKGAQNFDDIVTWSSYRCKRGFSLNGKLLVENLHTESLIAQRRIHDYMWSYDLQAHDLDITRELLDSVSSARKLYFQSQKERLLAKEKFFKDVNWLNWMKRFWS